MLQLGECAPLPSLIAWLQWVDPNGSHEDGLAVGDSFQPHTRESALQTMYDLLSGSGSATLVPSRAVKPGMVIVTPAFLGNAIEAPAVRVEQWDWKTGKSSLQAAGVQEWDDAHPNTADLGTYQWRLKELES